MKQTPPVLFDVMRVVDPSKDLVCGNIVEVPVETIYLPNDPHGEWNQIDINCQVKDAFMKEIIEGRIKRFVVTMSTTAYAGIYEKIAEPVTIQDSVIIEKEV